MRCLVPAWCRARLTSFLPGNATAQCGSWMKLAGRCQTQERHTKGKEKEEFCECEEDRKVYHCVCRITVYDYTAVYREFQMDGNFRKNGFLGKQRIQTELIKLYYEFSWVWLSIEVVLTLKNIDSYLILVPFNGFRLVASLYGECLSVRILFGHLVKGHRCP